MELSLLKVSIHTIILSIIQTEHSVPSLLAGIEPSSNGPIILQVYKLLRSIHSK
jgi:hypothetical protein